MSNIIAHRTPATEFEYFEDAARAATRRDGRNRGPNG